MSSRPLWHPSKLFKAYALKPFEACLQALYDIHSSRSRHTFKTSRDQEEERRYGELNMLGNRGFNWPPP